MKNSARLKGTLRRGRALTAQVGQARGTRASSRGKERPCGTRHRTSGLNGVRRCGGPVRRVLRSKPYGAANDDESGPGDRAACGPAGDPLRAFLHPTRRNVPPIARLSRDKSHCRTGAAPCLGGPSRSRERCGGVPFGPDLTLEPLLAQRPDGEGQAGGQARNAPGGPLSCRYYRKRAVISTMDAIRRR